MSFLAKSTQGDKKPNLPLWTMPDKGVFTQDLRRQLLQNKADVLIHSYKDLALEYERFGAASALPSLETQFVRILPRADQRDMLLLKKESLQKPPSQIRILSSSLRRIYLLGKSLKNILPKRFAKTSLDFHNVRGNIDTRLRKLMDSPADALVLAKAALDRLLSNEEELFFRPDLLSMEELRQKQREIRDLLGECEFMILPLSLCPNAAGQGALVAEIRKEEQDIKELLLSIACPQSAAYREREILASLGGGCHQKTGIACLEGPYGKLEWVEGLDPKQELLSHRSFQSIQSIEMPYEKYKAAFPLPKDPKQIWPLPHERLKPRRIPLQNIAMPAAKCLWVSRADGWPAYWEQRDRIIWCTGLASFFRLAQKDLWVHGCSEALGESYHPQIDKALGYKGVFCKLSHQDRLCLSHMETLCTYRLEWQDDLQKACENLRGRSHFYWSSPSQYALLSTYCKSIKNAQHACAPGLSYRYFREQGIEAQIFFDYHDWLQRMSAK